MFERQRFLVSFLLQTVLFLSVIMFALYQFKRNTLPQPIFFTNAENDLKAGKESAARKEFDDALRKRPTDPVAYESVIEACGKQNKPALVIEYTQRAIEACKRQPPEVRLVFYRTLFAAYSQEDQPPHQQRAIAAAKEALDLAPDNHIMENDYGYLLADNAAGPGRDVSTALIVLKRALEGIKQGPQSPEEAQQWPVFRALSEDSYGWALYKNEQYPEAVTALTQAIEDYPENAPGAYVKASYYHLGMAFLKLGKNDQAKNALNSALAYDAKYTDALAALAVIGKDASKGAKGASANAPVPTATGHGPVNSNPDDSHRDKKK